MFHGSITKQPAITVPRILTFRDTPEVGVSACRALGFTQSLLLTRPTQRWITKDEAARLVQVAKANKVEPWLEIGIAHSPHKKRFTLPPFAGPFDPRRHGMIEAPTDCSQRRMTIGEWTDYLLALVHCGITGFFWRQPDATPPVLNRALRERVRKLGNNIHFLADTIGLHRSTLRDMEGSGFDYTLSSLPSWNGRDTWFIEEHAALSKVAPVIATLALPDRADAESHLPAEVLLPLAAATGNGILMPLGCKGGAPTNACKLDVTTRLGLRAGKVTLRALTSGDAPVTAFLRTETPDPRTAQTAALVMLNPDLERPHTPGPGILARTAADFIPVDCDAEPEGDLSPGELRVIRLRRARPIKSHRPSAAAAADHPRIVIDNIVPSMDGGDFAIKRIHGDTLIIEADIFADGHEQLSAAIIYRTDDAEIWSSVMMVPVGNDRWRGELSLRRIGRHVFAIEAWLDRWGGFVRDLIKKRDAGQPLDVTIMEGLGLIQAAGDKAEPAIATALTDILVRLKTTAGAQVIEELLSAELGALMTAASDRPFRIRSFLQPVQVDRQAAAFASWYELFPRSQTTDPSRHGTFLDVIPRLPAISRMGFDVLYFPPIHPIGQTNRKGPNNSLVAAPGDPGSPYAIGSIHGGHDAIHPGLGSIEDFRLLVSAAHDHGLEMAMDFAVQCSPDHPWLAEHRDWFAWRTDGSLKYAENPPKKYEDIVNVDFYSPGAVPDLWLALRDIVKHWISHGVRIFRVDNPHTKPLPFWRWLIDDIHANDPDIIFLAEAFTRPKMMARLAKIGFTQSYTYFTWRNEKAELIEYMTELNSPGLCDYFRPNFFVNTPDINPFYLQNSGRAGFLIRAALAATLSGLWGLYSGYELCEAAALPGREEYRDSEKYQIRPRDWSQPGNISEEIATLNRIRRSEPALQTHLGLTFYNAFNEKILYFGKAIPGEGCKILVAVSLDPHQVQEADHEVPLWEWGLPDDAQSEVTDLLHDRSFIWNGKIQHIRLSPTAPYAIWRVRPRAAV